MSALQVIENKIRAVWPKFDSEAHQALEQALTDAKAEAGKLEADVRADIRSQLLPLLEQFRADAAVAVETAGPGVTAEVTKVVGDFIASLERLAGAGS